MCYSSTIMRYVLGVIGMIILGVIAVILFGRVITHRNTQVQVGRVVTNTTDYINDKSEVEFVQYGAVVSDEQRRTLKILVTQNERKILLLKGYEEKVDKMQTFGNNYDSYNVFMRSLNDAGFTRKQFSNVSDPTGLCPTGLRYSYILQSEGKDVSNLWNTSCQPLGGSSGTNGELVRQLFQRQIPDYSSFISGVSFFGSNR